MRFKCLRCMSIKYLKWIYSYSFQIFKVFQGSYINYVSIFKVWEESELNVWDKCELNILDKFWLNVKMNDT